MNILVCIKQVPDMESRFAINAEGKWFDDTDLAYRMNEYDEYAVEQAVQTKAAVGDADITVLSIGPDRVKEAMKKALAMGCDRGIHVSDPAVHTKDPYAIASTIAAAIDGKNFDLIFTGLQSQDRGSAQVGVLLSELLNIDCVTTIVDFEIDGSAVTVKRELEGGKKAVVNVSTPAVLTCQLGLNTPRYPTLPNIMKAKKKELLSVDPAGEGSLTDTASFYYPEKKGGGLVLEGDVGNLADQLIALLKEKTTVL